MDYIHQINIGDGNYLPVDTFVKREMWGRIGRLKTESFLSLIICVATDQRLQGATPRGISYM